MANLRAEPAVRYKRYVKRVVIDALRSVFTNVYPDPQFRNLNIALEYPLKRELFPAIVVNFDESRVLNTGVGHVEFSSINQKFFHYMFEGALELRILTLTPLDRDVLSDSIVELIAFGRLQSLTREFFEAIYSDDNNGGQIMFNSDVLTPLGENVSLNNWGEEDQPVYQTGYRVELNGAFYSNAKSSPFLTWIDQVNIYPWAEGEPRPDPNPLTVTWEGSPVHEDEAVVISQFQIESQEEFN